jgi:hypothetical protein
LPWSAGGPTLDTELHKPWEHCHMSCGPQTALDEFPNCASHFIYLH